MIIPELIADINTYTPLTKVAIGAVSGAIAGAVSAFTHEYLVWKSVEGLQTGNNRRLDKLINNTAKRVEKDDELISQGLPNQKYLMNDLETLDAEKSLRNNSNFFLGEALKTIRKTALGRTLIQTAGMAALGAATGAFWAMHS